MAISFGNTLFSRFTMKFNGKAHNALVIGVRGLKALDFSFTAKGGSYSNSLLFDAEKTNAKIVDSNMCWAAVAANALAYSGWGKLAIDIPKGKEKNAEDIIFSYIKSSFKNVGLNSVYGESWFFGQFPAGIQLLDFTPFLKNSQNGNFFNIAPTIEYYTDFSPLESILQRNQIAQMTFNAEPDGKTKHAVSVFGCTTDPTKKPNQAGYYTGIFITDSDDYPNARDFTKPATDMLRYVPLSWNATYKTYKICEDSRYFDKRLDKGLFGLFGDLSTLSNYGGFAANVRKGTTIKNEFVYGGTQNVHGTVSCAWILKGGRQTVFNGGKVISATIRNFGIQTVKNGGITRNAKVSDNGTLIVNGGTAVSTTIDSRGSLLIESSGNATSVNVQGGKLTVTKGTASGLTLGANAQLFLKKYGVVSNLHVSEGARVYTQNGATLSNLAAYGMMEIAGFSNTKMVGIGYQPPTIFITGSLFMNGSNSLTTVSGSGSQSATIVLGKKATLNLNIRVNLKNIKLNVASATLKINGYKNIASTIVTDRKGVLTFDLSHIGPSPTISMLTLQKKTASTGYLNVNLAKDTLGVYSLASNLTVAKNTPISVSGVGKVKVNGTGIMANGRLYYADYLGNKLTFTIQAVSESLIRKNTGTSVSDIFYGSTGDDIIDGRGGRDVIVYDASKWGKDTILKITGSMTILFKDINADMVRTKQTGSVMTITLANDSAQSIKIQGWSNATHKIVYGGTMRQLTSCLTQTRPAASKLAAASIEVWKKTGLLA